MVVGAGPAGLEAARVLSARGHRVTVFEAASEAGGQVRLAARVPRRRELIGIVDWRLARCEDKGVTFHFNSYVGAEEVLAEDPEVVVIATGGLPNTEILAGAELAVSSWDILSGDAPLGENVLLYDDNASHPGLAAAEMIAANGAALEIVTPERFFAADVGGLNHVAYARCFDAQGTRITINKRVLAAERAGNRLKVTLGSDYSERTETREVDQLVVEHGTLPLDDLYFELKPLSANLGAVDYEAMIAGRPQEATGNPEGRFRLYRIGDAVASRNVHAAIYDALRLCKDI